MRYLVGRRLKSRTLWYWQPTPKLIAAGFRPRRLADDIAEATREAEALNAELDRWYGGNPAPPAFPPGSLAALDARFQADDEFMGRLSPRSQQDYCRNIKAALEGGANALVSDLGRRDVKDWYQRQLRERGPSNARNAAAALRRLLSFGVDAGWIKDNPALRMRIRTPESRSRVWTLAERDGFVDAAERSGRHSMALAVMLGWCLGQRPADLRKLAWSAYDGAAVALRQAKTGTAIWVPALPELRALLDRTPRQGPQIVVSEATGRPYQESDFQHRFAEIRDRAGLPRDLQFRDLRRTLATALGAAGCTDDQIRAITGHKTRSVVAVYVRPDRTFAEGAMERLERARKER